MTAPAESPSGGEMWLVLGGSSSVARAFAHLAAAAGAAVLLAGRDRADLERTAADVRLRRGGRIETLYFDANPYTGHAAFAEACRRRAEAAGATLNVFLCFGLMPEQEAIDRDFGLGEQTILANFTGAASILTHLAPILEAQRKGRVVVLSSVAGDRGRLKNYVYGSAKAGLNAYLQGLRARLCRAGVGVTTVKAGFLDTSMTYGKPGLFLVASPEACAKACLRLANTGRDVAYFPAFWWAIMAIIKVIPERLFKRMSI